MSSSDDWLDQIPATDHDRFAEILDEYLADAERGVLRSADDLIARHPEWAEPLRRALQSLEAVQRVVSAFPATNRDSTFPQLGDYQIVREIGRGGMGIVYEARQLSLGRTVALKVLPFAAVLDPTQVQRFQNEAQAAAQLHHPHIVPVFSVGCERGVHYYSMQFINGQSLDQAIRELRQWRPPVADSPAPTLKSNSKTTRPNPATSATPESCAAGLSPAAVSTVSISLPSCAVSPSTAQGFSTQGSIHRIAYVRTAVELMVQAADALHYAHESGVIHRDVKPSNLLVDRRGKLSVADFGLARCQSMAHLTQPGGVCGTIRYMSPEQATGRGSLVDLRADVYGLGVTLYELLSLRPPFDGDDRETLLRRVVHEEPIPLRQLNRTVPHDLETIVLKAMSKSREDRYESAEALASDLRRFLAGQPTVARRPSAWDRTARWVGRHAKLVAASLALLAACLFAVTATAVVFARLQHRTEQALREAELHLRVARATVDDFSADLSEQLASIPGTESVRLAALERAEAFYAEFEQYAGNDPRWQRDAAIAATKRALVLERLGRIADADDAYQRASQRHARCLTLADASPDLRLELALGQFHAGQFWIQNGRLLEGLQALEVSREHLHLLVGQNTADIDLRADLLHVELAWADALFRQGQATRGQQAREQAVASGRVASLLAPHHRLLHSRLALGLRQLAESTRESDVASRLYEESLAIQRELVSRHPSALSLKTELASTLNSFAARTASGDPPLARALFREARELLAAAVRQRPDNYRLRSDWAITMHNEGMAAEAVGEWERSLALLDEAIREQTAACEASGNDPSLQDAIRHYRESRERVLRAQRSRNGNARLDRPRGNSI